MKFFNRFALGVAVAIAPLAAFAQEDGSVQTETADVVNNSAFGDWIVNCEALTTKRTACRLVQEQSLRESGALVARFITVPVSDGAILLAQVPMGVYLPGGAVYRFADNEDVAQREMIWQRCVEDICEAAAPLDDDELALFAQEDTMLFGFRPTADSDPVILSVDISEFATAVQLLRDSNS